MLNTEACAFVQAYLESSAAIMKIFSSGKTCRSGNHGSKQKTTYYLSLTQQIIRIQRRTLQTNGNRISVERPDTAFYNCDSIPHDGDDEIAEYPNFEEFTMSLNDEI